MAQFLARSQFARVTHHYRSSLALFSTTPKMKIPDKYLSRTEERNEEHRKVQQLVKNVALLSCESTAKDGVCDVYVVGVHRSPGSCREAKAIMSYLKPSVLFLQLCESQSSILHLTEFEKYSVTDLVKAVMDKPIHTFRELVGWSIRKYVFKFKLENSEDYVAYQEAKKYGSNVVLGGPPIEVTDMRLWRKRGFWTNDDFIEVCMEIIANERDKRDKYMAHQLLEVARKNSSVVAIIDKVHMEGIQKYWKQPIEVEDLGLP